MIPTEGSEYIVSQSLQALHKVVSVFEYSKDQVEKIIDNLPFFFVVIDEAGRIYRANESFSKFFGIKTEKAIVHTFFDLLGSSKWNLFSHMINRLDEECLDQVTFEVSLQDSKSTLKTISWTIRRSIKSEIVELYEVSGKDLSFLKENEIALQSILSCLPVVLLSVNQEGIVSALNSKFAEVILGSAALKETHLRNLLFTSTWDSLGVSERAGVNKLLYCLGKDRLLFEEYKDDFPEEFYYDPQNTKTGRWLRISYSPLVEDGILTGIVLIIQDATDLVEVKRSHYNLVSENNSKNTLLEIEQEDKTFDIIDSVRGDLKSLGNAISAINVEYLKLRESIHGQRYDNLLGELSRSITLDRSAMIELDTLKTGIRDWRIAGLEAIDRVIRMSGAISNSIDSSIIALDKDLKPEEVDLPKLTIFTCDLHAKLFQIRGISLNVECEKVSLVNSFPMKISSIIIHLLSIAMKIVGDSGTRAVEVSLIQKQKRIILTVEIKEIAESFFSDEGEIINDSLKIEVEGLKQMCTKIGIEISLSLNEPAKQIRFNCILASLQGDL